ncbi:MAG: ribosome biogenesis GTPase YlqF [Ruminococcaceae bacterium]|nr:ribosome biogenesis GTPase YlqF [Oscillospiraceae bacterium]
MPSQTIQWFPGHMAKTRRLITENLKSVDAVIEILDARIPYSSRNPEISRICADKPTIILLNKSSLADKSITEYWAKKYTNQNTVCIETDCISGQGISSIAPALKELCHDKVARYEEKGMMGRAIKVMVVGIPNVGKSSLINKLCGTKKAKVENRPGVTLDKQWVTTNIGIQLLDMPGVLWPKFEDAAVGENLAITGAIKDDVLDIEAIASALCGRLRQMYPDLLATRYKLGEVPSIDEVNNYDLLRLIGKKRGHLISGGEIDTERTANMLIDEYRAAKIGRISLDAPTR